MTTMWRWALPKGSGPRRCSVESVTIRVMRGPDERAAIGYAESKGLKGTAVVDEFVRASIVKVDDEPIDQPFNAMDSWNKRTIRFLYMVFNTTNGVLPDELKAFKASALDDVGGWRFTVPQPKADDPQAERRACEISSIVVREVTLADERKAQRENRAVDANEDEMNLIAAIVSVDDQPLTYERYSVLSSRARRFLTEARDEINGIEADEASDFLSSATADDHVSTPSEDGDVVDEESSETG